MSEPTTLVKHMAESQLMRQDTFWNVLRESIIPREMTDEQAMVFLAVSNQLNLNPLNGEIYPMISKGRVMPLVGIDGWIRRANDHREFDGLTVLMSDNYTECTVTIHRKDRSHPTVVTEYLSECKKDTPPWRSHPRRMLRHRTIIQGVRIAFGSGGAVDEDDKHYFKVEGEVVETDTTDIKDRSAVLSDTLKRVAEKDEPAFTAIKGKSCEYEGCKKRLIQQCPECGRNYCPDHWVMGSKCCNYCDSNAGLEEAEVEPIDPETPPTVDQEPDPDKYPQNPGKDPMEDTGELPW